MGRTYEGSLKGEGLKVALVVARFNELVTKSLLEGAQESLCRHGVREEDVDTVWVPGAFEIPLVASRLAGSRRYDAVVCLGAVIRGETSHFEQIATQSAAGVARAALESGVPVIYGILTTDTLEQALERAGGKVENKNKGRDAGAAAIEMANLLRTFPTSK